MIGGVQYVDGHKPVQTMKNRIKLAGWSLSEQTAAEPSWARTYNDKFDALVLTGATKQNGTPDPSNPIYPASAGGILRVNGVSVAELPELNGIYGVGDTLDLLSGDGAQRWAKKVFDGTETMFTFSTTSHYITYRLPDAKTGIPYPVCSHYKGIGSGDTRVVIGGTTTIYLTIYDPRITDGNIDTPEKYYAWLAAQYAAGTPFTLSYQLATPVPFTVAPLVVPTRYPTTALTQDNAVKASITAAVKVAD